MGGGGIERRKSEKFNIGKKEKVILGRSKSLSDEDLDELKGCLDLGFGFSYEEIPGLCNTLPALELCYSMSHSSIANANWRISSPGDHPEDVKARLKFWAQAVACIVKLCS